MKVTIQSNRTFATEDNADKAVTKAGLSHLRYFVLPTKDGRFFPVFIGVEAIQAGVHFHFNVVG